MMRRNLLLIVIVILGLIVTLGLQGCGLLGGGDDAAEGEAAEGEAAAGAEAEGPGAEGMPAQGPEAGPAGPGMGGPGPEGAAPEGMGGPAPGAPAQGTADVGGPDASKLVAEGMAAKRDGDYVTARKRFEAAVEANPDSAEAHWGLAWIYAEMADAGNEAMEDRAIEEFETFLELGGTQEQVQKATNALDRLQ
jgi:tetratricopeptide (TPR) repeat protein